MMVYTMWGVVLVGLVALFLSFRLRGLSLFEKIVNCALIVLCIHAANVAIEVPLLDNRVFLSAIHVPYGVLYGPLYYLAFLALREQRISKKMVFLQTLPFVSLVVFYLFCSLSIGLTGDVLNGYLAGVYIATLISLLAYGGWAFFDSEEKYESLGSVHEKFLGVLGMLLFMAGLLRFLPLLGPEDSIPQVLIEGLGGGNVFFFACMMGAAGLILSYRWGTLKNENQNALPPVQNGSGKNELVVDGKSSRYTKSSIPESLLSEYELAVSKYLVEEGAFLDEDISLEKVAKKLRVPRHHMSQVFTLRLGKTFSHYVNDLRIAHAVNLLALRSDLPINELASQSGYSSRISFVRHFKRVKGCPPSHYSAAQ